MASKITTSFNSFRDMLHMLAYDALETCDSVGLYGAMETCDSVGLYGAIEPCDSVGLYGAMEP